MFEKRVPSELKIFSLLPARCSYIFDAWKSPINSVNYSECKKP